MRKISIIVIIILLIGILIASMYKGFDIGKIKIASLIDIKTSNQLLDDKIDQVEQLNEISYKNEEAKLSTSINSFNTKKMEYNNLVYSKSISEREAAIKEEKYELEFIWTQIGFYANYRRLWLKAALTNPSNGLNEQYDINITVRGGYNQIKEFINDIETDHRLGFRIEEFSMIPFLTEEEKALQANASEKDKDNYPTGNTLETKIKIRNVAINLVNIAQTEDTLENAIKEAKNVENNN